MMQKKLILRLALLAICGVPVLWLVGTALSETTVAESDAKRADTIPLVHTNQLGPGPDDGRIGYLTARMLEQFHYLRHPLDDEFSSKFLDRYLEALDPQHLHFLASDIAQFEQYRDKLDDLMVGRRASADTTPAYVIFNRFMERLEQRSSYVQNLLKTEKFEFDTSERIQINRKDEPYPRDLDEAKQLWLQRVRYEYLEDKLGRSAKTSTTVATKTEEAIKPQKKTEAEEIVETLVRRYNRNLHYFRELDGDDVLEFYLTALAHTYDPHSDYFSKSQADNFAISMSLALVGIGAELKSEDGYCTINKLIPGGPAEKSKLLRDKDRIVAVAQSNSPPVDVVDMNLNKVVQMIRGQKGTEVRLTIVSDENPERRIVALIRDEIKIEDQEVKSKVLEFPTGLDKNLRVGVIDLPSFYATIDGQFKTTPRSTSVDVARLLTKFKAEKVAGVILDLRRNGGGSLEEAIRLTGLFIKEGPVVQVNGPEDRHPVVDNDPDPEQLYDGPLIVLTSRYSASASEILAGALQDYGRALIVGDISTHGKGTVQNLNPLRAWLKPTAESTNDPGSLKVTIRKFYRASGASTQVKGVMPDIVLPSVLNHAKDTGEASLENALDWDMIPGAKYDKLNLVAPVLPELLRLSRERITTNQDFAYIHEDIELFRKRQADKTISLNEAERRKEKDEDLARKKARDAEILARKSTGPVIHELVLKQVDLPGLPPPSAKTTNAVAASGGNTVTSAAASNSVAVGSAPIRTQEDSSKLTPPVPDMDATLEETERIMLDFIKLSAQKGVVTTAR